MGDLETVLLALAQSGSRYLVVGGVAVVLHGYPRFTADLDLVVSLDSENLAKALGALDALGYRPRAPVPLIAFADPETRKTWVMEKGLTVFSLWSPRFSMTEVDIFVEEPFDFEAAFTRRVTMTLDFGSIPTAAISDLIALKRKAGRPRDLADIVELEKLDNLS